jgi:two-component system response regulator LytT
MQSDFNIVIVDDEVLIAEFLKDELIALGYTNLRLAHNKQQALKAIADVEPDLILLDIRMKDEKEGIEIAEEINRSFKIPFVFITAHSDKEIIRQALATNPLGYLTKPFKQMDVYAVVLLAETQQEKNTEHFLVFKNGYETVRISCSTILYAQSDDNYIHIFTTDKKYTIRNTLEWFRENTPSAFFHQSHRSFVVNITKITKTTSKSVFVDTVEIPVSRGRSIELK